jgi:alcohol dehydrogenase
MQQLTCTGPGQIEWREVESPALESDTAALVRPLAVARCDIDVFLTGGFFGASEPFALGHECVGEIEALGDAVRGFEIGQRVVVSFQVSCGTCAACSAGNTANCDLMPTLSDYGMRPLSGVEYGGMLSERIRVPFAEAMLHPVPSSLDSAALASVSDNVLDGYRAVAPHLKTLPGSEVLIVSHGIPSIPLYAAQTALALGAERVDFASGDEQCLALAERMGARPIATDFAKPEGHLPEHQLLRGSGFLDAPWPHVHARDSLLHGALSCLRADAGGDVADRGGTAAARRSDDAHGGLGRSARGLHRTRDQVGRTPLAAWERLIEATPELFD